jgi:hypothetical protein
VSRLKGMMCESERASESESLSELLDDTDDCRFKERPCRMYMC